MKSVFFLFFAVFIGFGFLLSDGMHTRGELSEIRELYMQATREIATLRVQNDNLFASLTESEQTIIERDKTIEELTRAVAFAEEKNRQLTLANAALQAGAPTQTALPDARSLLIFLPLIPASIAATYVIVRASQHAPRIKHNNRDVTKASVQLTEEEVKEVIRMRRRKH